MDRTALDDHDRSLDGISWRDSRIVPDERPIEAEPDQGDPRDERQVSDETIDLGGEG